MDVDDKVRTEAARAIGDIAAEVPSQVGPDIIHKLAERRLDKKVTIYNRSYMYVYLYVCMYVCMYACMYVWLYACRYVY